VLLKTLPPLRQTTDVCEYLDVEEERSGQSARRYFFDETVHMELAISQKPLPAQSSLWPLERG
jgi:hypothetical protein